ncbi:39S ribosomal protein L45, mitochondrial [Apis mellifera caucasica]|uniref:Large ribosomal subunit protein mL45 n=1 Tax=Apis mellifera TaxID=7460 RepID=A0A7M7R906_APIME|nr:probable 39S ribosomal protein L45, mitochondrial [Apis mellifera]KAG6798513.1 39S ribosomal protein L45, mitochondrial [Apis mellifera caucasica]KAG9434594.1 39S ribosomal protein L45, mitochondrial [Apis mellifera carnica]|eukprot:XP_625034.1 probable 39S ribosomal protein L45, mitochondrial [Apis mellifera]
MMSKYRSAICIFEKYTQNNLMLSPINNPFNNTFQQIRSIKKHFNQKYRKERGQKFIKIELPNYNQPELGNDEIRLQMKKYGIMPQRTWNERPIYISSTPGIFESYIVPEGDGKFSPITTTGAKQKIEFINKKSKSFIALRKIKGYEENYTTKTFLEQTLDIYKKAHEALCTQKKDEILKYVTETAYPIMIHNIKNKTIIWKFMESLEPARLVHARVTSIVTQGNEFAQVTIRFHTQQILCIYDRFGRVLLGSETVKKDVLDYIVFEKHLSNEYGIWRIHGKIIPDWMSPIEVSSKTYILPKEKEESTDSAVESVAEVVPPETLDKQYDNAKT